MDDLVDLQAVVSREKVMRFLPEGIMSPGEVNEVLKWVIECYGKNRPERIIKFTVAVELNAKPGLVGWCGLGPLDFRPSEIEIFCGLSDEFWGRGYALEAVRAIIYFGFETIKLRNIVAVVDPRNFASKKLVEKMGMVFQECVSNLPDEHKFYEGFHLYFIDRDVFAKVRTCLKGRDYG